MHKFVAVRDWNNNFAKWKSLSYSLIKDGFYVEEIKFFSISASKEKLEELNIAKGGFKQNFITRQFINLNKVPFGNLYIIPLFELPDNLFPDGREDV